MTTLQFLAEWALRSSVLILSAAALLAALRVKDSWVRSAVWTAALCASLAMPLLCVPMGTSPAIPLPSLISAAPSPVSPAPAGGIATMPPVAPARTAPSAPKFDWAWAGVALYGAVAFGLLLRLAIGLWVSGRLARTSQPGGEFRESDGVMGPVTIGIVRPQIVLPKGWREWDTGKLDAVLAHERAHIRRGDPAWQAMSALYRALLWFNPLSWYLHSRIVRTAEEACDDAAVNHTGDQVKYAEVLLEFAQRGVGRAAGWSVPMARYGKPETRINRILDGARFSSGLTRIRIGAIVAIAAPLACLVAQTRSQAAPQATVVMPSPVVAQARTAAPPAPSPSPAQPAQPAKAAKAPAAFDLTALGSVQAVNTVRVTPRVEGQLVSVSFREGQMVQAGDLLATLDPKPYEPAVAEAEGQLEQDQAHLFPPAEGDLSRESATALADVKAKIRIDQAKVDAAKLRLNETQLRAPISGMTGLRQIDAGNVVHPGETIVVITQLAPVDVVFTVPEFQLPGIRARLNGSAPLEVEVWTADSTRKIAAGEVVAIDNQIDPQTGTGKVKAAFTNKDGALFPGEFVQVRVRLGGK